MGYADRKFAVFNVLLFVFVAHQKYVDACGGGRRRPRDGNWGPWGPWSSCITGSKTRFRYCNKPSPAHGGRICPGSNWQIKSCPYNPCSSARCQHICIPFGVVASCRCRTGYVTSPHDSRKCVRHSCQPLTAPPNDIQAPSFGQTCPANINVLADVGQTSATVRWGPVRATDNDQASVTVTPNVVSPYLFSEGVLRCAVLFPPANGRFENEACGNVHGRVCRFSCNKGYELRGSIERTCKKKADINAVYWTGSRTYCKGVGHEARDRSRLLLCCICKQEGHFGVNCEYSWVFPTIHGTHTDENQDVNSDEEINENLPLASALLPPKSPIKENCMQNPPPSTDGNCTQNPSPSADICTQDPPSSPLPDDFNETQPPSQPEQSEQHSQPEQQHSQPELPSHNLSEQSSQLSS
ncbi:A disintegrin and metalloproteinase with thrombospondin motifs 20 [Stylophora pistillata]|uniref:A disintegrin and metalloproteinase with thrombospondin motifs 20 n=1 Tax=Stylophora pistillata TaxID=50429 RepID=A0A2B4S214_STYPI|nr:A disintegrin and metalloproteinase with thrombospondin motifs 20 [Stylophora pistillata]